jgi:hypothetical protein
MNPTDTMPIQLQCRCGQLRGEWQLRRGTGAPGTCYCNDCQAYARWLGSPSITDAFGGTEIVQTWPALVRWNEGSGQLRLMKLTRGGLLRFYSECCRVPLMNAMARPRMPFIGLVADRIEPTRRTAVAELLGKSVGVQGRYAVGGCPPDVLESASLQVVGRALGLLLRGFFAGAHAPSPVFGTDRKLVCEPAVLTKAEHQALYPQGAARAEQ